MGTFTPLCLTVTKRSLNSLGLGLVWLSGLLMVHLCAHPVDWQSSSVKGQVRSKTPKSEWWINIASYSKCSETSDLLQFNSQSTRGHWLVQSPHRKKVICLHALQNKQPACMTCMQNHAHLRWWETLNSSKVWLWVNNVCIPWWTCDLPWMYFLGCFMCSGERTQQTPFGWDDEWILLVMISHLLSPCLQFHLPAC